MTMVLPSTVALPHPSCLSERLKCASQMFGAYTCRRHSLWHDLCGCVTSTQTCICTAMDLNPDVNTSMWPAEVHSHRYANRWICRHEPTCRHTADRLSHTQTAPSLTPHLSQLTHLQLDSVNFMALLSWRGIQHMPPWCYTPLSHNSLSLCLLFSFDIVCH